ncbi:putative Mitochondrial inner membrane protease subunit [Melia azedarach]|uniref:Mitochondrial inner membrane protease subunit n=1 Tax=Melia azedarach TaxID=155640 RepID=A0ACC1YBI3_MELAZ|nr:putative Mitochondrial inner membrane protease subunit [Melia azedarach]
MATHNFLWSFTKNCFTFGLIGLTISDRYASIVPVRGMSMSPTFNPKTNSFLGSMSDDYLLVEKFCLEKYKFSHGDVIIFRSPGNHKEKHVKRIIGLPGDWVGSPSSYDVVKIPNGHCWVEGDNPSSSMDSRSFGPIPLGLVRGRVTHIVWPPQRIGAVEGKIREDRLSSS